MILALLATLALCAAVGLFLWWLLIETEGVYLGRKVVIWLYDLYSDRYDRIKGFSPVYESWLLAQPLLGTIAPQTNPLVLDVATGTGRLPVALLEQPTFQGRVVGIDLSRKMLNKAATKFQMPSERVSLIWGPAERLPFPDDFFDVVSCLESLEFMTHPADVLREMIRVLRPGGLLLITNRIRTRVMPGKLWSADRLERLLDESGVASIEFEPWQVDYQKVWGLKDGSRQPTGARPLAEVLCCPRCPDRHLVQQSENWTCPQCAAKARVAVDGVIELLPLYGGKE